LSFVDCLFPFAASLQQRGTPIHVLKELGGWETMEMVQGYAYLLADHLAQWVQPMTAMPAKPQLVAIRGDAGTGEFAGTLVRIGAPGWDRTSNPCLRRASPKPMVAGSTQQNQGLTLP
jgi:hypothetical protein